MSSGFRNTIDAAYCADPAHRLRWERTLSFLLESAIAGSKVTSGLDLGDRTPMTGELEKLFRCPFSSTGIDLDVGSLEGRFAVVTAFEVLEHLFNPLHGLLEVRKVLCPDPDARVFVSTPVSKPDFLKSPEHFHEMTRRSIEALFERAGFSVVRRREFRIRPFHFYLTGFKPFMRCFFEKIQIYELALR
jgi:hypothetical protein